MENEPEFEYVKFPKLTDKQLSVRCEYQFFLNEITEATGLLSKYFGLDKPYEELS